jgi:hypothetical protein
MNPQATAPPAEETARGPGLTPIFLAVVCVELVTLAGLYWLGRHFG